MSRPQFDPRRRRVHLSVMVHPDTVAFLKKARKDRSTSMGLLVDQIVRSVRVFR